MTKSVPIVVTHQLTVQQQNWFKHAEAAAYCRVSPRTLRRWRSFGRVKSYGGMYFRTELDDAVRNFEAFTRSHPPEPRRGIHEPDTSVGSPEHEGVCPHTRAVFIIGDDGVSRCVDCNQPR